MAVQDDVAVELTGLDLLVGAETPLSQGVPVGLQPSGDTVYPQDFWMDAEDESLGGGR